jgi:putative ABC transport system permease protein
VKLAHTVNQRRREIGIRMALGAAAGDMLSQIMRHAALMICIGLTLGLGGAVALTRVMNTMLFEMSALDPLAFLITVGAMTVVGLAAALVPAMRACRVDPVTALRTEV